MNPSFKPTLLSCALLVTLVAGCATQTPYQPAAKRGEYGYSETQLTDNRYRISFNGNPATPVETTKDYALLRSAELTLQKGYDWFELADRGSDRKLRSNASVGSRIGFPAQTEVYQRCGLLQCDTVVSRGPGFGSEFDFDTPERATYATSLEIVMGKKPMPTSADTYDARQLADTLHRSMNTPAEKAG